MFSGGFRGQKLKTSLRLSISRLKLMEKKKTEMALKARKEIADFIQVHKYDRARIRVEHIIREDYIVEAMELVELYCDLLLARFGLLESMKHCDEALVEAVSSIIWSTPRLSADCQELRTVAEQLAFKYGKEFSIQARSNMNSTVNERLVLKLSPEPPPKILVERYLIEIAKNFDVPFEPDQSVLMNDGIPAVEFEGIETGPGYIGFPPPGNNNNFGPPPPGGMPPGGGSSGGMIFPAGTGSGQSLTREVPPYPADQVPPYPVEKRVSMVNRPLPPTPNALGPPNAAAGVSSIPDLPDIPTGSFSFNQSNSGKTNVGDDVDFDDLTRRFDELKKRK